MKRPGLRLRALAARFCTERTMERLIDPGIADLQLEHAAMIRRGRAWRARWVRFTGCVGLAQVLVLVGLRGAGRVFREWSPAETRDARRASAIFVAATTIATGIVAFFGYHPPRPNNPVSRALLIFYLIPSILPLSVAAGMTFAVACGLRREPPRRKLVAAILTAAVGCSIVMFADLAWVVPKTNQAFREAHFGGPVARGVRELSMSELRQPGYGPGGIRERDLTYHTRWSISAAPLVLTGFCLLLVRSGRQRRLAAATAASGICLGYWALWFVVGATGRWTMFPAMLLTWSPNVLIALLTATIAWRSSATPASSVLGQ